eukprot:UN26641
MYRKTKTLIIFCAGIYTKIKQLKYFEELTKTKKYNVLSFIVNRKSSSHFFYFKYFC